MSRCCSLRGRGMGVCNTPLRPGTCEGSKNGSVFATVGGVWWGVCNTPLRPGTCCLSKKCPVFVPFGAVCGAYAIRPYDRVRAALQKTVSFSSPSGSRGGRMRYAPTTGYVRSFEIPMQFPSRIRIVLQKTVPFSSPSGPRGGAYAIHSYDRILAILRNTDEILQPATCGPSKMRPFKKLSRFRLLRGRLWGVFDTPLRLGMCDPTKY